MLKQRIKRTIQGTVAGIAGLFLLTACMPLQSYDVDVKFKSMDNISQSQTVIFERTPETSDSSIEEMYKLMEESAKKASADDPRFKFTRELTETGIGMVFEAKDFTVEEATKENSDLTIEKIDKNYELTYKLMEADFSTAKSATVSIEMPAKIISAEGATIKGDTAVWDLKSFKDHNGILKVVSKTESNNNLILIGLGIASIILVGGLIIINSSRSKKGAVSSPFDHDTNNIPFDSSDINQNPQNTQNNINSRTDDSPLSFNDESNENK